MVREDPEPSFFIYKTGVGVDLRKTVHYAKMLQNRLDKEEIRITYYLQITPRIIHSSIHCHLPKEKSLAPSN